MSGSPRNSVGSADTHSRYTHSESTRADNYSDSFESEPENGHIKQASTRKVKKSTMQWKKKQSTQRNTKLMKGAPTYEMEQKIVTAKKMNNNDLRNLNVDLLRQIEQQKEEIRLLKRMEYRQGKALDKFENSNNRLPMLLESHNKEMLSLREQVRTMKSRYRKSQESLREVEDEIEKTKNRLNKYKVLVDDESLQERAELTRQLNMAQQKVQELEMKIHDLETYVQHLVKNHKHEVSIEKTQSKKTKVNIQELEEKYNRLEIQLLLKKVNPSSPKAASDTKINQLSAIDTSDLNPSLQALIQQDKAMELPPPIQPPPPALSKDTSKFVCQESIQEEVDLGEMLENIKLDKSDAMMLPDLKKKKKKEPPERTAIKEAEEELKKLETEMFDEDVTQETKKRVQKEEEEERKKKDLLLARLKELDSKYQTLMNPKNDPFTGSPSCRTDYSFSKQTENLHQGKPSNDLDFLEDSPVIPSPGKPNSLLKPNQPNVGTPTKKGSRLSTRKSDNMIEDFFPSPVSPPNPDGLKMSGFVNGDGPVHQGSSEKRARKSTKMESSVYKELFGENGDESNISAKNRDDLLVGDLSRRSSRQDWINQTVGGLFSGDSVNNGFNEGSKLLPSRQNMGLFEHRSTLNTFDNSSDSIEEIIL